ncbi:hypothetical protein BX616_007548 [Lobosporangium transversale]|uniref:Uncharacterized protein n=1 Tax=Lobosporangium transversale TaxID=64571 RepID=A0A1Y2G6S9_9FUNG|nr:hypothetical protein BCR41DRAFT_364004 [Lobosporangium transversale]KAF9914795.1 hypothetical protein BX616_007548 [Lobosporangium transversale]ORY99504.1 hypothetical protein BCR41DRAFT_364004 [Lobosporangium transversale]|eukprot:XP_021875830.1 hypothetical protein BCR41DRAFT_364004 [Lobosporangium transversale]
MKPKIGQSKLAILKHAPSVHRKRRPIDLHNKQDNAPLSEPNLNSGFGTRFGRNSSDSNVALLRRTATPKHGHGHSHPPPFLRRQITRQKSFMELDSLPSMRALRREPSMMELDPPPTLFAPAPQPSNFMPGPWAFFQAAEAQREQRQAQLEFLTRLQELRVRDEQTFVRLMSGFAKECPIQFAQLTGFMKRMEMEMEMDVTPPSPFDTHYHQQQQISGGLGSRATNSWGQHGTKMSLLALAQAFGNQIDAGLTHRDQFQRDQKEQLRQQQKSCGHGNQNWNGKGIRNGYSGNNKSNNRGNGAPNVPSLRRGKTFQQHQHALQQLTAYQRHLYEQIRQMHQQRQGDPSITFNSSESVPMAYELMQYAAMLANNGNPSTLPPLFTNISSPMSTLSSPGLTSPISPIGVRSLLAQMQHHGQQQQGGLHQGQMQHPDPLELTALNVQMNMGSSRRSRYKPPPLRSH